MWPNLPTIYVIEDFDLEQLPGSDEIAGYFDVGFRWGRVIRGVIMSDRDGVGSRYSS